MLSNINDHLHEDALLEVFDRMPLHVLIGKMDKVCTRWAALQQSALCRRREVTLLVGRKALSCLGQPFDLQIFQGIRDHNGKPLVSPGLHDSKSRLELHSRPDNLDSFTALGNRMVTLMPNITKLFVVLSDAPAWTLQSAVSLLTSKWSLQLQHLHLNFEFNDVPQEDTHQWNGNIAALFEAINKMPHLRHLSVSLHNRIFPLEDIMNKSIDLPILARLEGFCFNSFDEVSIIYKSLKKYAQPNRALKLIKVGNPLFSAQVEPFLQVKAQLAVGVQFLYLYPLDRFELTSMIAHYSSLTSMCLMGPLSLPQIVKCLVPLKQLSWLRLHIHAQKTLQPTIEDTEDDGQAALQLPHLKALLLFVHFSKSHKDIVQLKVPSFFPGLERLEIVVVQQIEQCSICKVGPNSSRKGQLKCLRKCLRELSGTAFIIGIKYIRIHKWP